MRRFYLIRRADPSGVSGVGVIAEGVCFSDWSCTISWLTKYGSEGRYPNPDMMMKIHGHDGETVLYWIDEEPSKPTDVALPV